MNELFARLLLSVAVSTILMITFASRVAADTIRVVDGDTIEYRQERLLRAPVKHMCRLVGFDTPETRRAKCAKEKVLGKRATLRLRSLIDHADKIRVYYGKRRGKYGRLLCRLYINDVDVKEILISEGLAHEYSGRGKRAPWC